MTQSAVLKSERSQLCNCACHHMERLKRSKVRMSEMPTWHLPPIEAEQHCHSHPCKETELFTASECSQ